MIRLYVTVILAMLAVVGYADNMGGYYPSTLDGKSGEDLLKALRVAIRSRNNVVQQYDEAELWNVFRVTDKRGDGTVWDIFSENSVDYPNGGVPDGMVSCHIVPPQWTGDTYPYLHDASLDVHNIFPTNAEVAEIKADLIPWEIENVLYDNGAWCMGNCNIAETSIVAYEPCDEYKGDVARVLMYVAVCYGGELLWQGQSWSIFNNNEFPVFTSEAIPMLLSWSRADPVDDKERGRNDAIFVLQGNRNPFVDFPGICEHVWGKLSDVPFYMGDGAADSEYLKPTYRLGEKIWLRSTYVPEDATWSVNGRNCKDDLIETAELGVGLHELKFSSSSVSGKVMIEVMP